MKYLLLGLLLLFSLKTYSQDGLTVYSLDSALLMKDKVTTIYLQSQGLTDLPSKLSVCTRLKKLVLDDNQFNTIPEVVYQLKSLEYLSIRGSSNQVDWVENENPLEEVSSNIKALSALKVLDLSFNHIKRLPENLSELKNLEILSLDYNEINSIQELNKIGACRQLVNLSLSANDIETLPTSFAGLTNLKILSISNRFAEGCPTGNYLNEFPLVLCQLTNLEVLQLDGHYFKNLPKEIGQMKQLRILSVFESILLSLPESIGNLENLTEINCASVYLGPTGILLDKKFKLPKSICRLKQLKLLLIGASIPENEMKRINACLPDCKFDN